MLISKCFNNLEIRNYLFSDMCYDYFKNEPKNVLTFFLHRNKIINILLWRYNGGGESSGGCLSGG